MAASPLRGYVAGPVGESHIFFSCVSAPVHDLPLPLPMSSPMHFVLQSREEKLGCFGIRIIVDTGSVDIQYFTPEDFFR